MVPDSASPVERIRNLPAQRRRLLLSLLASRGREFNVFPLSAAQKRMWFLYRSLPQDPYYNVRLALTAVGRPGLVALGQSAQVLEDRHEILRVAYPSVDGVPVQSVAPAVPRVLPVIDLSRLGVEDRHRESRSLARREAVRPFDLETGPVWRARRLWHGPERALVLLTFHHIGVDGASLGVLLRELAAVYGAALEGKPPALAAPDLQYPDYAAWEGRRTETDAYEAELATWRRRLRGFPRLLDLPRDRPRPPVAGTSGGRARRTIPGPLEEAVESLARRRQATLFMVLSAVCFALLYRLTGQSCLPMGIPVSGRHRPGLESLVGMLADTRVLTAELTETLTFPTLLDEVRADVLAVQDLRRVPFDRLVEACDPERDATRSPLFQVMFSLQSESLVGDPGALGGTLAKTTRDRLEVEVVESKAVQFDLLLTAVKEPEELRLEAAFRTDLFDRSRVEGWLAAFETLLEWAVGGQEAPLGSVDLACGGRPREANTVRVERELSSWPEVVESRAVSSGSGISLYGVLTREASEGSWAQRAVDELEGVGEAAAVERLPLSGLGEVDVGRLREHLSVQRLERWASRLESGVGSEVALSAESRELLPGPWHVGDLWPGWRRREPEGERAEADPAAVESVEGRPAEVWGGELEWDPGWPETLADVFGRAASTPGEVVYVSGSQTESQSYRELWHEARRVRGCVEARGVGTVGSPVLLVVALPRRFLPIFWGLVLAGRVPVPVSVPASWEATSSGVTRLRGAWERLDRPWVVVEGDRGESVAQVLESAEWLSVDAALEGPEGPEEPVARAPDEVALMLLTSGSTGAGKLVQQSHRTLLRRCAATVAHNGFRAEEVSLSFFPLDHVGGLVMFHLRDVWLGCRQVQGRLEQFVAEPLRWLDWLSDLAVTVTWAPNFAYGLVNERLAEEEPEPGRWDLSPLWFILNGGEAVVGRTAREFLRRLGPYGLRPTAMRPAWGMSETCSGVTYSERFSLEAAAGEAPERVEVGRPVPGVGLRIVDGAGRVVAEGAEGALEVCGETVTPGYYGSDEATAESFDGRWFCTGDLGVLQDGRLTITGREKDVVILHGVNYYSQEIEAWAEELDGIEVSYTAAVGVRDADGQTDRLALFFHPGDGPRNVDAELLRTVRERIARELGTAPTYLVPLERDEVPKTAIGKIQRSALRHRLEAGDYEQHLRRTDRLLGEHQIPGWFFRPTWRRRVLESVAELVPVRRVLGDPDGELGALLEPGPGDAPGAVVCLPEAGEPGSDRALRQVLEALWACGPEDRLLVVTRGAQAVLPGEAGRAELGALGGLLETVRVEQPRRRCVWLDLPADAAAREVARRVRQELAEAAAECRVAWRWAQRWVHRLTPWDATTEAPGDLPWDPEGFVLATGALGGLGREVTRWLLETPGGRVLAVGRRPRSRVRDQLRELGASDRLAYEPVHLGTDGDETDLEEAVARWERRWDRPLAGAVHLAGELVEGTLKDLDDGDWRRAWMAKARGGRTVARVLARRGTPEAPRPWIAFSSANGHFGGRGVGAYAAANAYLDALARELHVREPAINPWSLAWSLWPQHGMGRRYAGAELSRWAGYHSLQPDTGRAAWEATLRAPAGVCWIGLDGQHPNIRRRLQDPPRAPRRVTRVTVETQTPAHRIENLVARQLHGLPLGTLRVQSSSGGAESAVGPMEPTTTEDMLLEIWSEVLDDPYLRPDSKFFESGGTSLKILRMLARIEERTGREVTVAEVFQHPSLRELAMHLDRQAGAADEPSVHDAFLEL